MLGLLEPGTRRGGPTPLKAPRLTIEAWAAWDPENYAAPEIERLAHELGE